MRESLRPALAVLAALLPASAAAFDLQAAVQAATAGDTLRVPAGRYPAPLVVDRPLTLRADGDVVIDAGGQGDVVRVEAPDVTLRGFTLRGSGDSLDRENAGIVVNRPRATIEQCAIEDVLLGIIFRNADGSAARGNTIRGKPLGLGRRGDAIRLWNSHHVRIEDNVVGGCRDIVIWYSRGTHLVRNEVSASRYGLHFMYAHESVLEDNYLHDNSVGVFLMYSRDIRLHRNTLTHNRGPSGYGLGLKDMDAVVAEENAIVGNRVGVFVDNSPQRIDAWNELTRNLVAYNDVALAFLPAVRRNRLSENAFVENVAQITILGGGEFKGNEFTVGGRGNYWSDYAGFDANGDGLGDVPYRNTSLFESLLDREPKLRLFLHGPAQQAVEFTARAFPVIRPAPRIMDTAPLMQPVAITARATVGAGNGPMSLFGTALLGAGSLVLTALRGTRPGRCCAGQTQAATCAPPAAAPADRPLLTVAGLHKRFRRLRAVDDVSFAVRAGEAVALWGANGAGKTTIIKCVLGLHRSRGRICIGGLDARRYGKQARRLVGYVSQELAFDADVSTLGTAAFFARLKGVPTRRAVEVLAQVGLAEHAHKRVGALSGGMKQRLALAVALLADPPLLLLDEPTSNLDLAARRAFLELLGQLKRGGKTVLFSTHRPEEVAGLADRVIVLEHGRRVSDGPPDAQAAQAAAELTLRLRLGRAYHAAAASVLRAAGYTVQPNCDWLHVAVARHGKAEPIQVLTRAGIAVADFELEDGHERD
ncbi:MAG: nitrous oxide reductase family maturation protein NosD [Planctomycetota bacterium]